MYKITLYVDKFVYVRSECTDRTEKKYNVQFAHRRT